MIYFWSDQHFYHDKVIAFSKRPFLNLEEMHKALITNYNNKVKPGDTCFFVGDFSFGTYQETKVILEQLNGIKVLVQGNHDKLSRNQYLTMGFQNVYEEIVLRLFGRRIHVIHYPRKPSKFRLLFNTLKYLERRVSYNGRWLIHGHTHGTVKFNRIQRAVHIGVDAWNYTPVSVRDIESIIDKQENYDSKWDWFMRFFFSKINK